MMSWKGPQDDDDDSDNHLRPHFFPSPFKWMNSIFPTSNPNVRFVGWLTKWNGMANAIMKVVALAAVDHVIMSVTIFHINNSLFKTIYIWRMELGRIKWVLWCLDGFRSVGTGEGPWLGAYFLLELPCHEWLTLQNVKYWTIPFQRFIVQIFPICLLKIIFNAILRQWRENGCERDSDTQTMAV